ncbi:hypothetical protein JOB18_032383 [Solea senegalensis]|uniref:Uncharacterized protein n=1 Tax=Solea senegalensis TaxID=28829 RepID=A0AAV6SNA3_SOLSE|nr:hypothetical protein JOB18_032383 [Solea senegalensis]
MSGSYMTEANISSSASLSFRFIIQTHRAFSGVVPRPGRLTKSSVIFKPCCVLLESKRAIDLQHYLITVGVYQL